MATLKYMGLLMTLHVSPNGFSERRYRFTVFKHEFPARSPLLSAIIFFSLALPVRERKALSHGWFNLHISAPRALSHDSSF